MDEAGQHLVFAHRSLGCNLGWLIIKCVNQGQAWKLLPQPSARATHFRHVTAASSPEPELQSGFDWQMLWQRALCALFLQAPYRSSALLSF